MTSKLLVSKQHKHEAQMDIHSYNKFIFNASIWEEIHWFKLVTRNVLVLHSQSLLKKIPEFCQISVLEITY